MRIDRGSGRAYEIAVRALSKACATVILTNQIVTLAREGAFYIRTAARAGVQSDNAVSNLKKTGARVEQSATTPGAVTRNRAIGHDNSACTVVGDSAAVRPEWGRRNRVVTYRAVSNRNCSRTGVVDTRAARKECGVVVKRAVEDVRCAGAILESTTSIWGRVTRDRTVGDIKRAGFIVDPATSSRRRTATDNAGDNVQRSGACIRNTPLRAATVRKS